MTEIQAVENELGTYKGLDVLAKSEGGITLLEHMRERICSDVEVIRSLVKGDEKDIRVAIANLNADLYLYRVLVNAEKNVKIQQDELDRLLKEKAQDF